MVRVIPFTEVNLQDDFWINEMNLLRHVALQHQWAMLEETGCIDNFRIVASDKQVPRKGFFFADSDAYKWLDAVSRSLATVSDNRLLVKAQEFASLIAQAQDESGYLFTYNQVHFPGTRWVNLLLEHETYCLGHLIEAGISYNRATGDQTLLEVVTKAADLLYNEFYGRSPMLTSGHQEIEIALVKLYQVSGEKKYLDLAGDFLEKRGRISFYPLRFLATSISVGRRMKQVEKKQEKQFPQDMTKEPKELLTFVNAPKPRWIKFRSFLNFWSGKYLQQHKKLREQTRPEGHAVRFGYTMAAAALYALETNDNQLEGMLGHLWDHMVQRNMFVTGGLGSIPIIEGFGKDYELNPDYAYCETCAALASMFWAWEMTKLTGEAKYADLFEWQLYNASLVGLGQEGTTYFYRNPLRSRQAYKRNTWYRVPCCPSNLTRTLLILGEYIYTYSDDDIWIHQWVGNECTLPIDGEPQIIIKSGLPWNGSVSVKVEGCGKRKIHIRVPGWARNTTLTWLGEKQDLVVTKKAESAGMTASNLSFYSSYYHTINPRGNEALEFSIDFGMEITVRNVHPKVKGLQNHFALSRGPIVYCFEQIMNPDVDIFNEPMDPTTFVHNDDGSGHKLTSRHGNKVITATPYYSWANQGETAMTVYGLTGSL